MGLFLVTLYAAAEHYSDEGVGRLMLGYVIGYFVVPAIVRSLAVEAYRAIEAERNAGNRFLAPPLQLKHSQRVRPIPYAVPLMSTKRCFLEWRRFLAVWKSAV